jgi:hypothetical protein
MKQLLDKRSVAPEVWSPTAFCTVGIFEPALTTAQERTWTRGQKSRRNGQSTGHLEGMSQWKGRKIYPFLSKRHDSLFLIPDMHRILPHFSAAASRRKTRTNLNSHLNGIQQVCDVSRIHDRLRKEHGSFSTCILDGAALDIEPAQQGECIKPQNTNTTSYSLLCVTFPYAVVMYWRMWHLQQPNSPPLVDQSQ